MQSWTLTGLVFQCRASTLLLFILPILSVDVLSLFGTPPIPISSAIHMFTELIHLFISSVDPLSTPSHSIQQMHPVGPAYPPSSQESGCLVINLTTRLKSQSPSFCVSDRCVQQWVAKR
ncbi:hypothetical protein B0O80DRAFT_450086 [Mortierella sp. GBAus27b]|nr:hypothetical protein B0O80DRAFT_450086 [Mortierella sp. GBAus27b]